MVHQKVIKCVNNEKFLKTWQICWGGSKCGEGAENSWGSFGDDVHLICQKVPSKHFSKDGTVFATIELFLFLLYGTFNIWNFLTIF